MVGETAVTVSGKGFRDLGDVKCHFGVDKVQAAFVNSTMLECTLPACTSLSKCVPATGVGKAAVEHGARHWRCQLTV